jgi:hypothetical protein
MQMNRLVYTLSSALLLPAGVFAETKPAAPKADAKTYTKEQVAALNARTFVSALAGDDNLNGRLDPDEVAKINKAAAVQMKRERDSLEENAPKMNLDLDKPHPAEVWDGLAPGLNQPGKKPEQGPFRMRSTVSDFSKPGGVVGKVSPAIFSFSRDYLTDSDTWTAKGAVGGFWEEEWADISAGIEFNRLETEVPGKKDIDSLTFRALLNGSKNVGKTLDQIEWSFGPSYATNFDFDGGLLGATAEVELLWDHDAFTGAWVARGGKGSALTLRNFIRAEGGGTVDDFPGVVAADDEYLRVGPQLDVLFWPFGYSENSRLKLKAGYGYMWEVLSEGPDYKNFSAGAEWSLDKDGHFVLTVEYINGRLPILGTDTESLLLSLGVRF